MLLRSLFSNTPAGPDLDPPSRVKQDAAYNPLQRSINTGAVKIPGREGIGRVCATSAKVPRSADTQEAAKPSLTTYVAAVLFASLLKGSRENSNCTVNT